MTAPEPDDLEALVDAWLTGFGHSRSAAVRRQGHVAEIDVESDKRRVELVLVEPTVDLLAEAAERLVGTTDVWLTVITDARRPLPDLAHGVRVVVDEEVLMVADDLDPTPPSGRMETTAADGRCFSRLMAGGVVAAQGQVAVRGTDAVFDRIGTHEAHRRQGMAADTMRTLTAWARSEGATRGLLAATVLGRPVYERLGFRTVGALLTLAGE